MQVARFTQDVSTSQIGVYEPSMENPFSLWTDRHVFQGFLWRQGTVFFGALQSGAHDIEVRLEEVLREDPDAARIIDVPFTVGHVEGMIEVDTITDSILCEVRPGEYTVRFEAFEPTGDLARVRLTFSPRKGPPRFQIVRADPELRVDGGLLLTAEPDLE